MRENNKSLIFNLSFLLKRKLGHEDDIANLHQQLFSIKYHWKIKQELLNLRHYTSLIKVWFISERCYLSFDGKFRFEIRKVSREYS